MSLWTGSTLSARRSKSQPTEEQWSELRVPPGAPRVFECGDKLAVLTRATLSLPSYFAASGRMELAPLLQITPLGIPLSVSINGLSLSDKEYDGPGLLGWLRNSAECDSQSMEAEAVIVDSQASSHRPSKKMWTSYLDKVRGIEHHSSSPLSRLFNKKQSYPQYTGAAFVHAREAVSCWGKKPSYDSDGKKFSVDVALFFGMDDQSRSEKIPLAIKPFAQRDTLSALRSSTTSFFRTCLPSVPIAECAQI